MAQDNGQRPIIPPMSGDLDAAYRRPVDPLKSAAKPEVIYRDLPSTISTQWDPPTMRQALAAHMVGQFIGSARLTEATLADGRIQATLGSRTSALLGQPLRHRPAIEKGYRGSAAARECHDAWVEGFDATFGPETLVSVLRWGIMMGFCLAENLWDTDEPIWRPRLKVWHPEYTWYNVVTRWLIAITIDGAAEVTAGDGKWALYAPHGEYRGWVHGAIRAVASPWLARQFAAYRDWPRYSEIHGIPIMKPIVPFDANEEDKKRFGDAVTQLGVETSILCPQSQERKYDLELLEAQDNTWQSFEHLVAACDMSIVLALLGQNLTTEVKEGSLAAARVHGDVRQDLLEHDNRSLSHFIYTQVARPFALFNFGDADLAPYSTWQVEPVEDKGMRAKAFSDLATAIKSFQDANMPLDMPRLMRQFALPVDLSLAAEQSAESSTAWGERVAAVIEGLDLKLSPGVAAALRTIPLTQTAAETIILDAIKGATTSEAKAENPPAKAETDGEPGEPEPAQGDSPAAPPPGE